MSSKNDLEIAVNMFDLFRKSHLFELENLPKHSMNDPEQLWENMIFGNVC